MSYAQALRELGEAQARGLGPEAEAARRSFLEAVVALEGLGNDMELSRTLTAYAKFLNTVEPYCSSESFAKERAEQTERAAELAAQVRHRPSKPTV